MKMTTRATSKVNIAQNIYLKRAGVASRIFAKYAVGNESVPTNLINNSGIKPLMGQKQQAAQKAKPAPKQTQQPQQATQPAAPAIEPIPANVPPPPYVPPPQSGLPPWKPMAPRKQASVLKPEGSLLPKTEPLVPEGSLLPKTEPLLPSGGFTVGGQQTTPPATQAIQPATPPATTAAAPTVQTPPAATTPPATPPTPPATPPATTPPASPPVPPESASGLAPGTMTPDGQVTGQKADSPAATPPAPKPVTPLTEPELAKYDTITDPNALHAAIEKLPPEHQLPIAQRWADRFFNSPENKPKVDGLRDLYSGDPQRANSPAAKEAQAFVQKLPQELQQKLARENFQQYMAAHPNASPQEQGNFMQQAWSQAGQSLQAMPWPAQLMMGLGLGAGLVGLFSSLFGEGGAESGLMGMLGIGAAGLIGANYGMFGNDARMMLGQGAVGLGRLVGMNIPSAQDFTPEGMKKKKDEATAAVQVAIMGDPKQKVEGGGWKGGLAKIEELRKPLDQLASTVETYGKDTAVTMLMGAMGVNDPAAAQRKLEELLQQRQQMMDPQYLRNQLLGDQNPQTWQDRGAWLARRAAFAALEEQYGQYPGATPSPAPPQK